MKTFSLFRAHLYRLSRSIWAWAVSAAFLAALCFALGGECLSVLLGVGQGVDVFGAWSNVLRAMPIPLAVFCPLFVGSELSCGGMRSKAAAGCEKGRLFGALLLVCFAYAAALYILSCALCYAFASLLGLGVSPVGTHILRCLCGLALALAYASAFVSLSCACKKAPAALAACLAAVFAETFLLSLFGRADSLATATGFGAPVSKLLILCLECFLPRGAASMLTAGGAGYPLYIVLPAALSLVSLLMGRRALAEKI